jgi:hypothetical protein
MYANNFEITKINNSNFPNKDLDEDPNFFLQNQQCYRFETIHNHNGIFDSCIDATYVITMEGSHRLNKILQQLDKFRPTSIIYILHNKGYKKCNKKLHRQLSIEDIVDANFQIFFHAYKKQFNNILVLEDDCIFSERLLDPIVVSDVCQFLIKNKDTEFIYGIGIMPYITIPTLQNHYQCLSVGAAHAWVFSKNIRDKILFEITQKEFKTNWDAELSNKFWNCKVFFTYKYPLAYQPFGNTENFQVWTVDVPKILKPIVNMLFLLLTKIFDGNTPEQAFENFYFYAKIWSFCIFALLFVIVVCLCMCLFSFVKNCLQNKKQ